MSLVDELECVILACLESGEAVSAFSPFFGTTASVPVTVQRGALQSKIPELFKWLLGSWLGFLLKQFPASGFLV